MRLHQRVIPFEIKSQGEGEDGSTFEGLGAVYNNIDWAGDIIVRGAFDQDITFTKSEGKIRDEHYVTTGIITDAYSVPEGLYIKGRISDTTDGRNQRILVKDRVITRLSVGMQALKKTWLEGVDEVKSFWTSAGYTPTEDDLIILGYCCGARLVERAKVYEVSTTWRPMNDKAVITSVKGGQRAGRSFADHSDQTLAVLEEFVERAERLAGLRGKDSRGLSEKSRSTLNRLSGRIGSLLAATEPPAAQADEDLEQFARFLKMGERLRGAQ